MRAADHRRHIPLGVKLHACLILLGFTDEQIAGGIEFDHDPAIAIRALDEHGNLHPAANDPHYIRPLTKPAHAEKTRGRGATTAGSDVGRAAKLKRLEKMSAAYREIVLRKIDGEAAPACPSRKRKIQSRGFGDQRRPFPNQRKDKRS